LTLQTNYLLQKLLLCLFPAIKIIIQQLLKIKNISKGLPLVYTVLLDFVSLSN